MNATPKHDNNAQYLHDGRPPVETFEDSVEERWILRPWKFGYHKTSSPTLLRHLLNGDTGQPSTSSTLAVTHWNPSKVVKNSRIFHRSINEGQEP